MKIIENELLDKFVTCEDIQEEITKRMNKIVPTLKPPLFGKKKFYNKYAEKEFFKIVEEYHLDGVIFNSGKKSCKVVPINKGV